MSTLPHDLLSIVYASSAAYPFGDEELAALLELSRKNNARSQLTGMLIYGGRHFLQVIEGPSDVLRERMSIIAADARHLDVRVLFQETIDQRQFPEWTMAFEPATDLQLEEIPGYRTSFSDIEDEEDPQRSLATLRELMHWFQDRAAQRG